ncbi:MAG: response regulator [Chloroflexi bacterium]|nr:response regulator [Chloroflexota bacterium]
MTETRILIVEDELIVSLDIQRTLERLGYVVAGVVSTGAAAITETIQVKPDLVLMDIRLEGDIDGIQAASQIREFSDVPIIYLTAYADDDTVERAKMTAPFGYLLKLFEERELQISLEIALARHDMERKLREHEQWLTITLGSIGDAVIATDAQGQIRFMNVTAQELTGWDQPEAVERDWKDVLRIIDEETGLSREDSIDRVFREGGVVSLADHTLLLTKDGQALPIEDNIAPITDRQGQISGVVLVFRSLTERRRAEAALAAERNLLRTLIDNLPDYIYVKDASSRFILGNVAVARIMGVATSDELVGKTDFDFYSPELAEQFYADEQEIIRSGQPLIDREEAIIDQMTGQKRWLSTTKVPVRDSQGQIVALVGMSRDITERKRLEEQSHQSQKLQAIGQLAGGIAHEFNNMLTGILGFTQLLLEVVQPEDKIYEDLQRIEVLSKRAAGLVRQLLTFSRHDLSQKNSLSLRPFLKEITKLLERIIPENIVIELSLAAEDLIVVADPTQLQQVVINLAVNARDAMPEGGRLVIITARVELDDAFCQAHPDLRPGWYALLSITDTGVGIPLEIRPSIFDPFFTTKAVGKGTGLGLPVVYGIVKNHAGAIEVESQVGQGTTMKIYLPLSEQPVVEEAATTTLADLLTGTETILLVEDEPLVLEFGRTVLEYFGYRVLTAQDGVEALEVFQAHQAEIALVILDVVMPRMGGRETARELKRRKPAVAVLLASGYDSSEETEEEPGETEAYVLVRKPYQIQELAQAVRAALEHR